jgi:hypothetical protein
LLSSTSTTDATINDDAIDAFIRSLDPAHIQKLTSEGTLTGLPLRFDTLEAELDVIAITNLLNFGSGWRTELKAAVDRGAFDTLRFGVISMHISGNGNLKAKQLKDLSLSEVSSPWHLPHSDESTV